MSKAVFIGGFSNSEHSVRRVRSALENYFDDVEALTFPEAMRYPQELNEHVGEATAISQSAGMLALVDTAPSRLIAFGAPFPRGRGELIRATAKKAAQMFISREATIPRPRTAVGFHFDSILELSTLTPNRGLGHFKHLVNGDISSFDAVEAGAELKEGGSKVSLVCPEYDLYYRPNRVDEMRARAAGIGYRVLRGAIHDSIVVSPGLTLEAYFDRPDEALASVDFVRATAVSSF